MVAESDGMEVERCARLEDAMAETVAEVEYQCASCEKTTVGRKRRWAVSAGERSDGEGGCVAGSDMGGRGRDRNWRQGSGGSGGRLPLRHWLGCW